MGREIRLQYENAWYHVMNRAAGKKPVFLDENNKYIFFEFLAETYKKYEIQINAFCLMNNHYHLLINTPKANLAEAMHYLQFRFSKEYNKIIVSDGPIFRSRYKSILIKNDVYLTQVCRYIHLNPVEAKISAGIDYRWSSYRHYLNPSRKPYWLHTDMLTDMISNNNKLSFIDFHKENNSEILKKFYKLNEPSKVTTIELELEEAVFDLNTLYNLTVSTLENKKSKASKIIFCFLAIKIYKYAIQDILNYLGYKNRSSVNQLLRKQNFDIDSNSFLEIERLKNTPDILIKNLYKHLQ